MLKSLEDQEALELLPTLDSQVPNLMHRSKTCADSLCSHRARDADDSRMRFRTDAPDVQVGDPRVAGAFHQLADFVLDVMVGGVEKDGGGVAHQGP